MKQLFQVLYLTILSELIDGRVKEHFLVETEKEWYDVDEYCKDGYGGFSVIESEEEYQKVNEAGRGFSGKAWIGLSHYGGEFHWKNGRRVSFSRWAGGSEPPKTESMKCVYTQQEKWHVEDCSVPLPFFCYKWYDERLLVKENKTWEEALNHCRTQYTDLTNMGNVNLLIVGKRKSVDSQTPSVWIGLRFLNGHWFWVNGNPLKNLASLPSCPAPALRCGALNAQSGRRENRDCEERLNFICYKK